MNLCTINKKMNTRQTKSDTSTLHYKEQPSMKNTKTHRSSFLFGTMNTQLVQLLLLISTTCMLGNTSVVTCFSTTTSLSSSSPFSIASLGMNRIKSRRRSSPFTFVSYPYSLIEMRYNNEFFKLNSAANNDDNDEHNPNEDDNDINEEEIGDDNKNDKSPINFSDLSWRVEKLRLEEANTKRFLKSQPRKLPYEECRKWVQAWGNRWENQKDWENWIAMGEKRNAYIPAKPDEFYGRLGKWISWEHFLGTETQEEQNNGEQEVVDLVVSCNASGGGGGVRNSTSTIVSSDDAFQ
mmetsp:Transcript_13480/g.19720  ORF Transcript_13480/g.19720 Transcript_13480/m.19720 type:complete len:294 (+) Transcript_13480:80-961(+)